MCLCSIETSIRGSAKATRLSLRSLEDQVCPLDVHPRPLVDTNCAGRVLGVDSEAYGVEAAACELRERVAQKGLREAFSAVLRDHAEDANPAEPGLVLVCPRDDDSGEGVIRF